MSFILVVERYIMNKGFIYIDVCLILMIVFLLVTIVFGLLYVHQQIDNQIDQMGTYHDQIYQGIEV